MDVLKEIERLENELIRLKGNQQNISIRLGTVNDELEKVIPTLKRFSQSLTEEEAEVLRRLSQFQEELTQLKENCKELGIVSVEEPAPLVQEAPQPIVETVTQPSVPLVDTKEEIVVDRVEVPVAEPEEKTEMRIVQESPVVETPVSKPVPPKPQAPKESYFPTVDWEKFIGENLISKLGILILLIGVAIGGKYALDHEMLSPAVRIIIGTVFGLAMQGVALKLKKDYKKFSAILSSGSSAILYFMTYFAYGFYDLIPKPLAFVLMILITAFSVFTAWWYDMEIVAIIGQVGAYVIPVLLSDGTGSVLSLWMYIAMIDAGILIVSIRKYWQKLFAVAFVSSWLIVVVSYRLRTWDVLSDCYGVLALAFVFFAIFYVSTLVYKVRKDFDFVRFDIIFLLSNSFLFFALGYNLIYNHEEMVIPLTLFATFNALIHCGVSFFLYKKHLVDRALERLVLALGVTFITVSIAIGTSGHWITIFWMMEALALFWVGRTRKKPFYENMSYPVLLVAMVSLMADWGNPTGADFEPLNWLATAFSEWRNVWDVHPHAEQGVVLPWVTTAISLLVSIAFLWIDYRYPSQQKDEKSAMMTKIFYSVFLSVLTLALFVHFTHQVLLFLLSLEFALVFFFARKKENWFLERISYGLIALTTVCALLYLVSHFMPFDDEVKFSSYMLKILPATLAYVLALASVVNFDRMIPCKEVNNDLSVKFSLFVRVLWVYFIAFGCGLIGFGFQSLDCCHQMQLGISVITFLWTIEVVAFFAVARYFKRDIYEKSLFVLLFLLVSVALCSVLFMVAKERMDWLAVGAFLFFVAGFFVALWVNKRYEVSYSKILAGVLRCIISILVVILAVVMIHVGNVDPEIYSIDFAMGFFALVSFFASKKNLKMLARFDFLLLALATVIFLIPGLIELSSVRDYISSEENGITLGYYLFLRYLSLVVAAGAIAVFVYYRNSPYCTFGLKNREKVVYYDTFLVLAGLIIGTSELFNVFDLLQYNDSYKLALSIFWGCCSVFLIYFGLFKQMKHLRIDGFVLFGVIIVKLFFYDLKHLDILSKAIVFVSWGVLLLVSSFFYQKIAKRQQEELAQLEGKNDAQEDDDKQED